MSNEINALLTSGPEIKVELRSGPEIKVNIQSGGIGSGDAIKLKSKPINIPDFTGADGYILAYNETAGEFYLKKDNGGERGLIMTDIELFASIHGAFTMSLTNINYPIV